MGGEAKMTLVESKHENKSESQGPTKDAAVDQKKDKTVDKDKGKEKDKSDVTCPKSKDESKVKNKDENKDESKVKNKDENKDKNKDKEKVMAQLLRWKEEWYAHNSAQKKVKDEESKKFANWKDTVDGSLVVLGVLIVGAICLIGYQQLQMQTLKQQVEGIKSEEQFVHQELDSLIKASKVSTVSAVNVACKFREMAKLFERQAGMTPQSLVGDPLCEDVQLSATTHVSSSSPQLPVLTLLEGAKFSTEDGSFDLGSRDGVNRRVVMQRDGNLVVSEKRKGLEEKAIWATGTLYGRPETTRSFTWSCARGTENKYQFSLVRPYGDYDVVSPVSKLTKLAEGLRVGVYDRLEIRYDGICFVGSNSSSHCLVHY